MVLIWLKPSDIVVKIYNMFFLKSIPIGQKRRRMYRFQIFESNRRITHVGMFDPFSCRGIVNLQLLFFFLRKGLIIADSRYHFCIFLLIFGYSFFDLSLKSSNSILLFIRQIRPYRSQFQSYKQHFLFYNKACINVFN